MDIKTKYVEVASGSVSNRGKVMQLSELHDFISKSEEDREIYYSWYCFDVNLKNHIEKTNTIQNFKGVYSINQIILDFDKADLSDEQLIELMKYFISDELVNNYAVPDDYYTIWYSGTGFHIHLADCFGFGSDIHLPNVLKTTMAEVFPQADNIYDGARLIRAGGTINNKSGLFKTRIDREDLFKFDMNDIHEVSSKRIDKDFGLWFNEEITIEPILNDLIKKPMVSTQPLSAQKVKFKGDPNAIVTCMQKAFKAGPIKGQRNETMMRLASWLRRNGTPRQMIEMGMTQWSGLEKESRSVIDSIFKEGYQYGCDDPIMAQWCSEKCIYYRRRDYTLSIKNAAQMEESFKQWIKMDFEDKSFNFADIWELKRDYMVYPGELIIILGDTGLGKTAFVQNLVSKLPNMSCLYLSLELHYHLMFRRFCQITHSLTKHEVIDLEMNQPEKTHLGKEFKQITVLSDPTEISRLEKQIAEIKPSILVVDTTDSINVDKVYNEFEKMNTIINTLKKIAISQDIIIIGVHHVNKESAKEQITNLHSAKGTTTVVQKADKVIAINGNREELVRFVHSEKSRDENTFKMRFQFRPETFKWEQMIP
jgi:archaellum biogenesis ATPase FlaH